MNDDLNTPKAIAVFMEWLKNTQKKIIKNNFSKEDLGKSWNFLDIFDSVFGFIDKAKISIPKNIKKILKKRQSARRNKDWDLADKLRDTLKQMGWIVEDTDKGQRVIKSK